MIQGEEESMRQKNLDTSDGSAHVANARAVRVASRDQVPLVTHPALKKCNLNLNLILRTSQKK